MVASSPGEAVLEEAGLQELEVVARGRWKVEFEKCLRVGEDNPRRELVLRRVRQRLKKRGWRVQTEELMRQVEGMEIGREVFPNMRPPWEKRVDLRVEWEGEKREVEGNRREAL